MATPDLLALAGAVLSRRDTPRGVGCLHCPAVPPPGSGTAGHLLKNGGFLPVSAIPRTIPQDSQPGHPDTPLSRNVPGAGTEAGQAGTVGNNSRLPANAARLLLYVREALGCRVTLTADRVTVAPTHRCPPSVLAALVTARAAVVAILEAEDCDILGGLATACQARAPALAGAGAYPEAVADRAAIAADTWPGGHRPATTEPPADMVGRLAQALAAPRPWQRVVGDPAPALAYFRAQPRNRLARLDGLARGLLVQAEEAAAQRQENPDMKRTDRRTA